jgi:Mrp family chromosome partitioning ATPase
METEVNALQARILELSTVVDPNLLALEAQMARNLERLVVLERERVSADDERQAAIRLEVADINQQIEVLLAVQSTQPLDPDLVTLREAQRLALISLQDLEERKARIELDSQLLGTGVTRTVEAVAAEEAGLATTRIILLGLIVGFVIGVGVAYALALQRRVFTERHQPEAVLGNPLLGEVPAFGYERIRTLLPTISDPQTAAAEGFRFVSAGIATQIDRQLDSTGSRPVVLAVTSAGLSDGKTVTAANTAVAAAFEGMKVLAIDADFASQRLTEILLPGNTRAPGITELAAGLVQPDQAMGEVEGPSGYRLDLLSRGAERTTAPLFFRDPGLRRLLDRLRDTYDLIVVDCPPLLQVAYTSLVLDLCDMVMTVQPHQGSVTQARDLKDRLDLSGVPAIGYAYNFAPLRAEMAVSRGSMSDVLGETPRTPLADEHTSHPSPASDGGSTAAKARRSR